jgi:membrane-bound lytic murein transglycosylase A
MLRIVHAVIIGFLCMLSACETTAKSPFYWKMAWEDIPHWPGDHLTVSWQAWLQSCQQIKSQDVWDRLCQNALDVNPSNDSAIQRFFEKNFNPWQVHENQKTSGLLTGYYEIFLAGSKHKKHQYSTPIYAKPNDLIKLNLDKFQPDKVDPVLEGYIDHQEFLPLPANALNIDSHRLVKANLADFRSVAKSNVLSGRIQNDSLLPYWTSAEIRQGALNNTAQVIAYADDPVQAQLLHIQGSGRIIVDKDDILRLGYADKNGHTYRPIGQWLINQGELPKNNVNIPAIIHWAKAHPKRIYKLLDYNPSYVFFTQTAHQGGPIGSLNIPLTAGFSIAVDKKFLPLGSPVFLRATHPKTLSYIARLVHAQDTGGAIRTPVRADLFWGSGNEAGELAGITKQTDLQLILLWPKGLPLPASKLWDE